MTYTPPEPTTRNRAFLAAYRKGRDAKLAGKPRVSPYYDQRTHRGSVTYSRAFNRYWLQGWDSAVGEREG